METESVVSALPHIPHRENPEHVMKHLIAFSPPQFSEGDITSLRLETKGASPSAPFI